MFGRMTLDTTLSVKPGCDPLAAVKALVELAEEVKVMKWIEFPDSILVFLMVPGDVTSGAIYVLDRKSGVWYWIDFEDDHYGGYSHEEFKRLLSECNLLSLVERPALLRSGQKWGVECGQVPVTASGSGLVEELTCFTSCDRALYQLESPIPIRPTVTRARDPSRNAEALSPNRPMPTSADPAAPIPVHTA